MRRSSVRTVLIGAGVMLCGAVRSASAAPETVHGPIEDIAAVEDFTADRAGLWELRGGVNVERRLESGYELPAVATTLLRIETSLRDPADREPGHNWAQAVRGDLPAGTIPAGADGLRVLLGSRTETKWWIQLVLTTDDGESFSSVIADHAFPAGRIVERLVPFAELRNGDGASLTPERAPRVTGLAFTLSTPGTALYIDRITAYRRPVLEGWLDFSTAEPATNLFERGERVGAVFRPGGTPPAGAAGFRYEVRDYREQVVLTRTVPLTGAAEYAMADEPPTHGYYEVSAVWTDAGGNPVGGGSCIRAEGTVPTGLATFSVLPCTVAENVARFRELGDRAFFGIHGDFLELGDHVGLAWRFGYSGWRWLEPERPNRAAGLPGWVAEGLNKAPEPSYRLHILPFRGNLGGEVPSWARRTEEPGPPPFANWNDYLAVVRDSVRIEKALYPHQAPRLYGGAWEIDLNMAPYVSQQPEHRPEDVVELFRRTRETVKAEDPEGEVLGPCPSVLNVDWFETVFKAGVLRHLDGIETHGYQENSFYPEENDYPGKLARIRELMRRYNDGRELPIYVTELGHPGILGTEIVHRSQAQRMVRTAIILKGEGVRVFLPFYGIDYDRAGYWGFFFNRDIDAPNGPWGTRRVSPKPMVNAMAACVSALEGSTPDGRLAGLGDAVHAYRFRRGEERTTAVWTPGEACTVRIPVTAGGPVRLVGFQGHAEDLPATDGGVSLTISDSPVYLVERPN